MLKVNTVSQYWRSASVTQGEIRSLIDKTKIGKPVEMSLVKAKAIHKLMGQFVRLSKEYKQLVHLILDNREDWLEVAAEIAQTWDKTRGEPYETKPYTADD